MEAIGNYLIVEETQEATKTTKGGLELTEKHREDIGTERLLLYLLVQSSLEVVRTYSMIVSLVFL